MNDRELLELAANAAGYKTIKYIDMRSNGLDVRYGIDEAIWNGDNYWNPLIDDGDALSLAVKLRLVVSVSLHFVSVWGLDFNVRESNDNDPYAATRRAIVLIAAAIGKEQA